MNDFSHYTVIVEPGSVSLSMASLGIKVITLYCRADEKFIGVLNYLEKLQSHGNVNFRHWKPRYHYNEPGKLASVKTV